jgi:hypothetical protein
MLIDFYIGGTSKNCKTRDKSYLDPDVKKLTIKVRMVVSLMNKKVLLPNPPDAVVSDILPFYPAMKYDTKYITLLNYYGII